MKFSDGVCKIFCFNISSGSGFVFLFFLRLFFPECRLDSPWISFEASTSNAEHLYFQLTYPCPNCGWVSIVFCAWNDYYHHKYKYKWIHFLILSSKFFQISGFFDTKLFRVFVTSFRFWPENSRFRFSFFWKFKNFCFRLPCYRCWVMLIQDEDMGAQELKSNSIRNWCFWRKWRISTLIKS